jgi:hypothetical protein
MNIPPKLILLALTACAFMAITAGTASAAEVVDEATGVHCATVITEEGGEGCPTSWGTDGAHLEFGGPFGLMYNCEMTYEFEVDEAGHMIASSYDWFGCEGTALSECTTAGHRHPEARITGGTGPWTIELDLCFVGGFGSVECHLAGTITELANHDPRMNFVHTNKCEQTTSYSLQGQLRTRPDAAHPAIEFR